MDKDEAGIIIPREEYELEKSKNSSVENAAKALCRTILRYEKCSQCGKYIQYYDFDHCISFFFNMFKTG